MAAPFKIFSIVVEIKMNKFINYKNVLLVGVCATFFTGRIVEANDLKDFIGNIAGVKDQDYDFAINSLTLQIKTNPTNSIAYILRAKIYISQGKYDEAIGDCNKLIQDGNTMGYALRGYVLYGKKDYDKAIVDFTRCINIKPIAPMYLIRARSYENKEAYDKAIDDYGNAIMLKANDSRAYILRCNCYFLMGKLDKAIADINQAIKIFPEYAPAYANRGLLYFNKGDYANAVMNCNEALILDQKCDLAYNNLAWILAVCPDGQIRNGNKALLYAKRACEISSWKIPQYLSTLGAAYAELENFPEAIKLERQALESGFPNKDLIRAKERLSLYEQRKPYRQYP